MKKHTNIETSRKGVTLIELSVVIAVILVLISVLFIGAQYYRNSANKSACVINQSAISKAAESWMNIETQATVTMGQLSGAGGPFETSGLPVCPNSGSYSFTSAPANGQVTKNENDGGRDGIDCDFGGNDHDNP